MFSVQTSRLVRLVPGLTALLGAFLLFQVQPLIGKFILPWFGGSPGVWTTCMLFFQVVLFAGYAYAHALTRLPLRWQGLVHGLLILAALALLPFAPDASWKPVDGADPVPRILALLAVSVGLPYFVLSSTAPLVQVWFTRATGGAQPWRLYALSNFGSLAALLSYPFVFEPLWEVLTQARVWSGAFGVFAVLVLWCLWRDRAQAVTAPAAAPVEDTPPEPGQRLLWLLLPALACALLLAATNHVCQNVAVIPFLWVLPLALYLLSFIFCFEHERWYLRRPALWAAPALLLALLACVEAPLEKNTSWLALGRQLHAWFPALPEQLSLAPNYLWQLAWAFGALFFACMLCHGELTRLRPAPRRLTEFYLCISAGGALGGLFVSLAAPRCFTTFAEWPGGLVATAILAAFVLARGLKRAPLLCLIPAATGVIACMLHLGFKTEPRLLRMRNFYGAMSVEEAWDSGLRMKFRRFIHGNITHGMQNQGAPLHLVPATYYGGHTGIGRTLESVRYTNARVGVVGLGVGTVACYAHLGHVFRFYEIDPDVERIATNEFTYLGDAEDRGAEIEIVIADGRLALEREPPQNFDVLLLDAFSGDSVPAHLLTLEAWQIYLRHLKPDGIIVAQISNHYLSLAPVVEKIASALGLGTTRIITTEKGDNYGTDHVIVTRNTAFLRAHPPTPLPAAEAEREKRLNPPVWTDRRHDLFQVLDLH
ncbi:MAG: spermidine synthase [Prosthecobacter sp.]|uniref:spermidine synthase n=1 Tax=Prosthecobacter sp. TaxID=1965333 RepID=UPI0038FE68FD